jgi:hypothetical protein
MITKIVIYFARKVFNLDNFQGVLYFIHHFAQITLIGKSKHSFPLMGFQTMKRTQISAEFSYEWILLYLLFFYPLTFFLLILSYVFTPFMTMYAA